MKNYSKGFVQIFILIILVLVGVGGIGYYAYKNGQIKFPPQNTTPINPSPTPDPTAVWKVYNDPEGKFSFKYPDRFVIATENKKEVVFAFSNANAPIAQLRPFTVRSYLSLDFTKLSNCIDQGHKYPCIVLHLDGSSVVTNTANQEFSEAFVLKSYDGLDFRYVQVYNKNIEIEIEPTDDKSLSKIFNQILSTFKFLDEPTPTLTSGYKCPESGWIDCMPGPDKPTRFGGCSQDTSPDAIEWYKSNCPNYRGITY